MEIYSGEKEAPKVIEPVVLDVHLPDCPNETLEAVEPAEPVDMTREAIITRKRPAWLRETLQDAERIAAPGGSFRESKRPHRFSSYMALMSHIIDAEPSSYEEAATQQVWKDAMVEEYQSIMKNDVWEIVPRPEGKPVVTSKWI